MRLLRWIADLNPLTKRSDPTRYSYVTRDLFLGRLASDYDRALREGNTEICEYIASLLSIIDNGEADMRDHVEFVLRIHPIKND